MFLRYFSALFNAKMRSGGAFDVILPGGGEEIIFTYCNTLILNKS